jgi:Ni,Fe-hydrogenase III large subunit
MSDDNSITVRNGEAFAISDLAPTSVDRLRDEVIHSLAGGGRLAALFARPDGQFGFQITAVIAFDADASLQVLVASTGPEYASITTDCPQAHWFEREIWEQCGIVPVGHPWLKPIRFQSGTAVSPNGVVPPRQPLACGVADFFSMDGEEVHEVAVGPVHAGVIEPGHFRFQCQGETVFHLEISLGYQHRGIERALVGGPGPRTMHYLETLAGDTSIGHATAHCRSVEALSCTRVPARAQVIRGVAIELERVANHIGDLGALAGDIGYLPTMSFCGRIRGDVLNMTAMICGNRFGRGLIRPGGVTYDLTTESIAELVRRTRTAANDARVAVELLWDSPSVMGRFEQTGTLSPDLAQQIGLVGVAARACGISRDVRQDFPSGIYRFAQIPVSTWHSGDVFARAYVRWLEVQLSLAFVEEQLGAMPAGPIQQSVGPMAPEKTVVTLGEGWRGEICHVATTDSAGRFQHYKVVDPSFHNWFGLAMAMRSQPISDFPLCNKSFSLSYCGHDL